jgi:hypothetical protein
MRTQSKPISIPVPTAREIFTANSKTYVILRFPEGLNLKLVIDATEGMKVEGLEMLTYQKAMEIRDNAESNSVFKEKLQPGEWTYVRHPDSESRSLAARLDLSRYGLWLCVFPYGTAGLVSQVVVLEKTGSEATVDQVISGFLR